MRCVMNQAKLLELITKHFSEEELKTVCFSMSFVVDYESLPAQGKINKARELIEYCERRGRLSELVKICQELRPKAKWSKLISSSRDLNASEMKRLAVSKSALKQDRNPKLKVFLCYSSGDKKIIRELYHNLRRDGFNPWLDEEDLLPGQDWRAEISKTVRTSDVVLVCLSKEAVSKRGYVQKEIKIALDIADEQPEGAIYLIPLRLEECSVPERLTKQQWVDIYEKTGYERLKRSLMSRFNDLYENIPVQNFNLSEIQLLINLVDWRQSRDGYSGMAPSSKLKTKLIRMKTQIEDMQFLNENLDIVELSVSLETVRENVNYISQYDYTGMSKDAAQMQKSTTLAPLHEIQRKLYVLISELERQE